MVLTKADLVEAVQQNTVLTKSQSADIIESILSTIKGKLISGEDDLVSGFGNFNCRARRPGKGGIQLQETI